jgi:hypothetical protein
MTELDPFYGAELEEQVISSMMGGRRVTSLEAHHFTHPTRGLVYLMLKRGVPYEGLEPELRREGVLEEDLAYIVDLFFAPQLPHEALVEAVADLKRLALLRPFCEDVSAWLKRAPHLTYEKAVKELGAIIRASGSRPLTRLSG